MERKVRLFIGETYHIYNRGAHKQEIFKEIGDYYRFLYLLHLSNRTEPIVMRDILSKYRGRSSVELFVTEQPDKSLVDVLAYCLMPNHFHIVLRQKAEDGITKFMGRVATGYSMYFNIKYGHSGTLFQGRFKSSHVSSESYFRYIFAYVHLNPLDLWVPNWKEKGIEDPGIARREMKKYSFSSFSDYVSTEGRPEKAILSSEVPDFLTSQNDLEDLLRWHTEDRPLYESRGTQIVDKLPRDTQAVVNS
jgi:putative transposase